MGTITISQIATALAFLVSLISSITYICHVLKKQINKMFEPIREDIKEVDKSQCKNYLVRFLSDVETNKELSTIEKQRAYECFEKYTSLGGNSYIHDWWYKIMKEGK